MIKTFRGLLGDDTQNRIRLSTKKGKIGYKIINFHIIGNNPGAGAQDSVMKIYKVSQEGSVDGLVDFSDGNLLGVAYWTTHEAGASTTGEPPIIIFEQEIFNQDIYITHEDVGANAQRCNYYLELETINLSDNAAAVSTLRDIRLNPQVGA